MMREGLTAAEKKKVGKPLLWIGMASILMAFAGLTSGYVVSRTALLADNKWLQFSLPPQFNYATVAILLSSLTLVIAALQFKKEQASFGRWFLLFTLVLGLFFALFQWLGWENLIERGLYFTGEQSNTAVSWVYVITGLHWAHVLAGLVVLLTGVWRAYLGYYEQGRQHGIVLISIFWHFLGVLWIYIYLFLLFIR